MPRFIEVTRKDGIKVRLSVQHIIMFYRTTGVDEITVIETTMASDYWVYVRETPDQVDTAIKRVS